MNHEVIKALTENAGAAIRYRTRQEILEESPNIKDYLDEILDDERVKYALSWQKPDGYFGECFHGGTIPAAKRKYVGKGAEGALRFLSEMGVPKEYPAVDKGLRALLKENWLPDTIGAFDYKPEAGLFGNDYIRSVAFAYFRVEEHEFIQREIGRAVGYVSRIVDIPSIKEVTGLYQNKLYFNQGKVLPDLYVIKLLAFTKSWRNEENTSKIAKAIVHLIDLSPLPTYYCKLGHQLYSPGRIFPQDLKKSLSSFQTRDWFYWMHTMELFARMGIVKKVPALLQQANELKEKLAGGKGFFPIKPEPRSFQQWGCYTGLALEDSWRDNRWKYDLTFRSLLILKYAGML
jgi:hypothetical protein